MVTKLQKNILSTVLECFVAFPVAAPQRVGFSGRARLLGRILTALMDCFKSSPIMLTINFKDI
jgi:hypothetical protein